MVQQEATDGGIKHFRFSVHPHPSWYRAAQYLRFKLRMFGIPMVEGHATNVFCDNESVVRNSTNVESSLNKKHNSIAYHYVRWCVAAGVITVALIRSEDNLADPFTKRLAEITRDYLFGNWTY
jgi:hypothetical protein